MAFELKEKSKRLKLKKRWKLKAFFYFSLNLGEIELQNWGSTNYFVIAYCTHYIPLSVGRCPLSNRHIGRFIFQSFIFIGLLLRVISR